MMEWQANGIGSTSKGGGITGGGGTGDSIAMIGMLASIGAIDSRTKGD